MAKIDLKDYLERLEEPEDREAVASREYQKELFEQYVQKGDNFPELREGVMKGMNPSTDAKQISRANGCRRAVEAPRGHAKSTNFTFKGSIHSAVYAYKHYEIILSDSSEQAEGFLSDIKTELEENAALREDFGELEGRVWKASVILLSNGVKI